MDGSTPSTAAQKRRARIAVFREACRREETGPNYSGLRQLAILTVAYLGTVATALVYAGEMMRQRWWLLPITWLIANIAEYHLHKGPMHHKRKGSRGARLYKRHAATHHRFFTHEWMEADETRDYYIVFFPLWMHAFLLVGLGGVVIVSVALLLGLASGAIALAGIASYILAYEWLHMAAHLPERFGVAKIPILSFVYRHHRRHHDPRRMRHVNFSIFFPLGDLLFGTLTFDDDESRDED